MNNGDEVADLCADKMLQLTAIYLQCCVPSLCQWHECFGCASAVVMTNSAVMIISRCFMVCYVRNPSRKSPARDGAARGAGFIRRRSAAPPQRRQSGSYHRVVFGNKSQILL